MGVANEAETLSDGSSSRSLELLIGTGCEGEVMDKAVRFRA